MGTSWRHILKDVPAGYTISFNAIKRTADVAAAVFCFVPGSTSALYHIHDVAQFEARHTSKAARTTLSGFELHYLPCSLLVQDAATALCALHGVVELQIEIYAAGATDVGHLGCLRLRLTWLHHARRLACSVLQGTLASYAYALAQSVRRLSRCRRTEVNCESCGCDVVPSDMDSNQFGNSGGRDAARDPDKSPCARQSGAGSTYVTRQCARGRACKC